MQFSRTRIANAVSVMLACSGFRFSSVVKVALRDDISEMSSAIVSVIVISKFQNSPLPGCE